MSGLGKDAGEIVGLSLDVTRILAIRAIYIIKPTVLGLRALVIHAFDSKPTTLI
jgi:hypothetical protein